MMVGYDKKILLTGGTGFVGRNVKEYLEQRKYNVYAPASYQLDCLDENAVKEHLKINYYDVVLHFAIYGDAINKARDGKKILEYNLRIFTNFAKYSNLFGKMIYTGSGAEYDKRYPIQMIKEEELTERAVPTDQYGLMKYIVNQMITESDNIYNLRLFGVFGKYEHWKTKFISGLCCKSLKGIPLSIRKNCYFDYLWVDDLSRMIEKFMQLEKPQYHAYNAARGKRTDLLELAEIVNGIADRKQKIIVCQEGMANEYTANNDRICSELPELRFTDLKESVSKLYEWYRLHLDEIDVYSLIYG